MTIQEQYIELQKCRKQQSSDILNNKKRIAWEYFRSLTDVSNLEKNLSSNFMLYFAPLKQIRGTNMVSWQVGDNKEIHVDESFAITNPELTNIQLQHEVLHGLTSFKENQQYFFGHRYDGSGKSIYMGLDEASTQMFAEDMSGVRLDENTDYLYTIKNVMRVMKSIFSADTIAEQFLNNSNRFEEQFNEATSFKFEPFALLMNDVYTLSKSYHYSSLTQEQIQELTAKKNKLFRFTSNLINQFAQDNPTIIDKICDELNDENMQQKLNIRRTELSDSSIHRR